MGGTGGSGWGGREEGLSAEAGTGSPVESGSLGESEFGSKTCQLSGKNGSQPEKINIKRQDRRRPENIEFTTTDKQEAERNGKP